MMMLDPEDEDLRGFLENDSPRSLMIEEHWRENFPKRYKALQKAGVVKQYAREATVRHIKIMDEARLKLGESGAFELAMEEWKNPPYPPEPLDLPTR